MLPASTQRRYNLLTKLFVSNSTLDFASFVNSIHPWQKAKVLAPSSLIIGYFIGDFLNRYQIKSIWSIKPVDFKFPEQLARLNNSRIQIIESPAIALGISEKLSELKYPIQLATVRGLIEDISIWAKLGKEVEFEFDRFIFKYASGIESHSEGKISSKKIADHCQKVLHFAESMDGLIKELKAEYPASHPDHLVASNIINRVEKQNQITKKRQLKKNKELPVFQLSKLCEIYLLIDPATFYDQEKYQLIIKSIDPEKKMGIIDLDDLVPLLQQSLSDPFFSKKELSKQLGGNKIKIFLPNKLLAKVIKATTKNGRKIEN